MAIIIWGPVNNPSSISVSRNSRTSEYKNNYDPDLLNLKGVPSNYAIPGSSGIYVGNPSLKGFMPLAASSLEVDNTVVELLPPEMGRWLRISVATDTTYALDPLKFPVDGVIMGVQAGVGKLTFTSTLINKPVGYNATTRDQGAVFALIHIGAGVWDIMGDLEAEV